MKGLLIKDYKLMLGQKSFLGMAALMAVLYLAIYKNPTFAVVFITVMCTMFTISTLSYDEYENGMAYLFTLPISRNIYVLEKYAFALVNSIVTGVIMYAMAYGVVKIRGLAISQSDMYSGLAGACFVSIIMISYMIPLYIKFGMEKSRIVSVSGMAAIFLILYLGIKISKERNGSIMKIISRAEKLSDGIVILLIFAVSSENGKEQIAMGKGLRFSYKVGERLRETDVEKIYMLKDEKNTQDYIRLLQDVPASYAEVIQDAVQMVTCKMASRLNEQIFVTLSDHLIYALERYKKGIVLQNRMLWEIQKFYPKEYLLGSEVLSYLNQELNVNLPEEEAGNIAFHIVNAQIDATENKIGMQNGMLMVKMLKDLFQIVQLYYQWEIDEESINYSRFVIHMQFFLQRLLEDKMLENADAWIYHSVVQQEKKAAGCVEQIRKYIRNLLQKEITEEERVYLIVHISRIKQKQ